MTISRFADGECNIKIDDSVRGKDVYIIQVIIIKNVQIFTI